jgi:hypothetical protein
MSQNEKVAEAALDVFLHGVIVRRLGSARPNAHSGEGIFRDMLGWYGRMAI